MLEALIARPAETAYEMTESGNCQIPQGIPCDIPFNKAFVTGNELQYLAQVVNGGAISANGRFTEACSRLLEDRFGIHKVLMVPSGTAALELAAAVCDWEPGAEVLLPSFTFASTANAILRAGGKPVFVDVRPETLNIDAHLIDFHVTPRTRAIFPVHYAGVSCEMDQLMAVARRHDLTVVEDAAQAVNARFQGAACGSIGDMGAFSFHSTKDFTCGEGGALCLRSAELAARAEILREKGTDRAKFLRGEVDKYTWLAPGSSYVPSELSSAYLLAQLEAMDRITSARRSLYYRYRDLLAPLEQRGDLRLPIIPSGCEPNYHMFYVLMPDEATRDTALAHLRERGIQAAFHFLPLHTSPMGKRLGYRTGDLPWTEQLAGRILRLPLYPDLREADQMRVHAALVSLLRGSPRRLPVRPAATVVTGIAAR